MALIITLIMLSITLVMAVAFLALAKRERSSVSTHSEITTARLAAESGLANAEGQIAASILANPGNAYNARLFVSTNYINPLGFLPNSGNPTNVNYQYRSDGLPFSVADYDQNIANLWILPRPPVFVVTNPAVNAYDFRYYLDLNQNGRFEANGWLPVLSGDSVNPYYDVNGNKINTLASAVSNYFVGDPEWVGVLEHPDQPHGPNNHFISRYAFAAVPIGNALDVNYVFNQAANNVGMNTPVNPNASGYFMRNQGVGAWEINLAAFLADLNTNIWGQIVGSGPGSPLGSATYYQYNQPVNINSGYAFQDAYSFLRYRYGTYYPPTAWYSLWNAPYVFPNDGLDAYSDGPLQTTLNTNDDWMAPGIDGDNNPKNKSWSGSDNPNHYFALGDFFDTNKVPLVGGSLANSFVGHLSSTGTSNDTYNAYTYYRLLDQLGTDSSPEDGKLNLNYSNAVVLYWPNGTVRSVGVVAGAETNLVPWTPQNFFIAAADQLLRLYTTEWYQDDPTNYLASYYGMIPAWHIDATGLGITNLPNYGVTNQIPFFSITNIPVLINSNFVYSPAINRLLQLAANLYDASTNNNNNMPHVFRPIFEHDPVGNVFIVGYTNLYSAAHGPNTVNGTGDPQLTTPHPISDLPLFINSYTPIADGAGLVNVYGVPWIIGAKTGLPNFNQFSMVTAAQITRKLQISRSSTDPATATYTTNQMYVIGISNNLGVSYWNSYFASYPQPVPRPVTIYAHGQVVMGLTNQSYVWGGAVNYGQATNVSVWPGSQWPKNVFPAKTPQQASFIPFNWSYNFQSPLSYNFSTKQFDPTATWATSGLLPQLDQFGLRVTNYLQTYILDGNNIIDYVQLRDPISVGNINQALADPDYPPQSDPIYYQWSINGYDSTTVPYGIINQLEVSQHPGTAPKSENWSTASTPMGDVTPPAEAAFFTGFFYPNFQYGTKTYINSQLVMQAPYTPTRTVFTTYLLQANDPLVHYLSSDLNSQYGAVASWGASISWTNGFWNKINDSASQPLPTAPATSIAGRYQPWGQNNLTGLAAVDTSAYNMAYKDPLVWGSDYWDFPTNAYPTVGWIGRVHRGTPWQTIYLKATNILSYSQAVGPNTQNVGYHTWAAWTGDIQTNVYAPGTYYDAVNSSPLQDRLLFDIFTTRFNDNAVRGTLPVNQIHLGAWSALFSGMVALTNSISGTTPFYTNLIINPAGTINPSLSPNFYYLQPPVWQLVDGPFGINTTRNNTNLFPNGAFIHAGDVLETPALSELSPFLNRNSAITTEYRIGDEAYEWLPQQMMGLVRGSTSRYVLYCYGQALNPAPGGTVLGSQLVTNYQVVAESAVRAVIRVDNANTSKPRITVESYNVLPPN